VFYATRLRPEKSTGRRLRHLATGTELPAGRRSCGYGGEAFLETTPDRLPASDREKPRLKKPRGDLAENKRDVGTTSCPIFDRLARVSRGVPYVREATSAYSKAAVCCASDSVSRRARAHREGCWRTVRLYAAPGFDAFEVKKRSDAGSLWPRTASAYRCFYQADRRRPSYGLAIRALRSVSFEEAGLGKPPRHPVFHCGLPQTDPCAGRRNWDPRARHASPPKIIPPRCAESGRDKASPSFFFSERNRAAR